MEKIKNKSEQEADVLRHPLKTISSLELEQVIEQSISKKLGAEYKCRISSIDYKGLLDGVDIKLTLDQPLKL